MSNNKLSITKHESYKLIRHENFKQIYADKMSSLAIGPNVARIGLGVEDPALGQLLEEHILIMPTSSLIELIEVISQSLDNPDLKNGLLHEIEVFKNKIL